MIRDQTYFDSGGFYKVVSALSQKANLPNKFTLRPLNGGRNNRVFSVTYHGGKKLLLKAYFQHPHDSRNRLKAEYSFLNFVWGNSIKCVPRPYAADFENNLALYEFIEGRKLSSSEINKEKVEVALNFFVDINKYKQLEEAKKLPIASEACFSIKDHIATIRKRIDRLKKIKNDSKVNNKALFFIQNDLSNAWKKALTHIYWFIHKYDLNPDKEIINGDRCISPSDFGFHNALLGNSGRLYFIDFEYAGIDDPAKMVCDFFCQPEVPVPFKYFDLFAKAAISYTSDPEAFWHRINALLPLYRIKWCCIMLNDFLEIGSKRRNFAYGNKDANRQKAGQLAKAREYLRSVTF